MAQVQVEEKYLEALGNALRKKIGTNDTWLPSEMPAVIRSLGIWSWVKDDGTHYFHLVIENKWQLVQKLNLQLIGIIDWGDGLTTRCDHDAVTVEEHTYTSFGKYTIHVVSDTNTSITWGATTFNGNEISRQAVRYYELGKDWTNASGAFNNLLRCQYIYIHKYEYDPTSVTGGTVVDLGTSWRGYTALKVLKCTTGISLTQSTAIVYPTLEAFVCPSVTVTGSSGVLGHSLGGRLQYLGEGLIYQASGSIVNQSIFSGMGHLRELNRLPAGQSYFTYENHFQGGTVCYKVIVPSTITSIPSKSMQANVRELHMLRASPPTLSTTIPVTAGVTKIYVPIGSLSAYQSATNWANYADYMVEE